MVNKIDRPNPIYLKMKNTGEWQLITDLLGGVQAMRDGKTLYLPKESKESQVNYETRLEHTFLFPGFADTISRVSSKPFVKPVSVEGVPEKLQPVVDFPDAENNNLTTFARELFKDAIIYGVSHFFVDFSARGEENQTAFDEKLAGVRPVFKRICPTDLIDWDYEVAPGGNIRVTYLKIHEYVYVNGENMEQIREITPGQWVIYRKNDDKEFVEFESGTFTFPEEFGLPMVSLYINKTGIMTAEPTFKHLAWLNLEHYQSASQQRNVLRFARTGLLVVTGASKEEVKDGIVVGANMHFHSVNPDAKIYYAEHTGAAIQAGERDLQRLEEQMQMVGLMPFVTKHAAAETATGKSIDEGRINTDIEAWVSLLDNALMKGFDFAAEWYKMELPEDFSVRVYDDFSVGFGNSEEVKSLITMRQVGLISQDTFLREIKRRGILDDSVAVEDELNKIQNAPPEVGI